MPAFTSSAPGKIILFGEHAVVYGRPAIAVPVEQVQARAIVSADPRGVSGAVKIQAPDIGLDCLLSDLPNENPLRLAIELVSQELNVSHLPACTVRITSTIPLAAGLGSGAAVSVALIRALSAFLGKPLTLERVSAQAYEVEKIYHGKPSGIDNTVVTFAQPVYFARGQPIKILRPLKSFTILIADSGIFSPTAVMVGEVNKAWEFEPARFEQLFDSIAVVTEAALSAIENGEISTLGLLMNENQGYLERMGVSWPELDKLIENARTAGALGAKLSGAGGGGNMIALVDPVRAAHIAQELLDGGAIRVIMTTIHAVIGD